MRPIFYLSNLFATAPVYSFKSQECLCSKVHSIYSILILITILIMCTWSIDGRYRYVYKYMKSSAIILDFLSFLTLMILNCLATLKLVLLPHNLFRQFLNTLRMFDCKSRIPLMDYIPRCFVIEMFTYQIYFILFCIIDTIFWLKSYDIFYFKYYLFRYVQYYQFITLGFLITQYAKLITDRFKYINDLLSNSKKQSVLSESLLLEKRLLIEYNNIKKAHVLYVDLTAIVEMFNKVFGEMLLLFSFAITIGLLEPLNLMLSQALTYEQVDHIYDGTIFYVTTILWSGLFLVRIIVTLIIRT